MKQNIRLFLLLVVILVLSIGCSVANTGSGTTLTENASSVAETSSAEVSSKEALTSSAPNVTTSSTSEPVLQKHRGALPMVSYEEYFAEERDWQYGWSSQNEYYLSGVNGVYSISKRGSDFDAKYQVYYNNERFVYENTSSGSSQGRLLFANASAGYSSMQDGYVYIANGGTIIRFDEDANWTVLYSGTKEICYIEAFNPCLLYFHDGETLYRMFLGNYYVEEICKVENRYTTCAMISSTDIYLETPTKEFVDFVQAGNTEDLYYGKGPMYTAKVYSSLTNKFYEIDYEKLFELDENGMSLGFVKGAQAQYLDQRNADLKK